MKIKGYLISGRHLFKKLDEKEIERYDRFFSDYKEQIEREIGRNLTKKEEERIYFLILGIMNKHKEYDERYHKYLLGSALGKRIFKVEDGSNIYYIDYEELKFLHSVRCGKDWNGLDKAIKDFEERGIKVKEVEC